MCRKFSLVDCLRRTNIVNKICEELEQGMNEYFVLFFRHPLDMTTTVFLPSHNVWATITNTCLELPPTPPQSSEPWWRGWRRRRPACPPAAATSWWSAGQQSDWVTLGLSNLASITYHLQERGSVGAGGLGAARTGGLRPALRRGRLPRPQVQYSTVQYSTVQHSTV